MAVCQSGTTFAEYLRSFEFIKAFTCSYFDAAGVLTVGLMVYGAIALSIYIRTGSIIIPVVLLLLTGGAVMTQIAGVGIAIATVALLTTGAGVTTYLYHAYSR